MRMQCKFRRSWATPSQLARGGEKKKRREIWGPANVRTSIHGWEDFFPLSPRFLFYFPSWLVSAPFMSSESMRMNLCFLFCVEWVWELVLKSLNRCEQEVWNDQFLKYVNSADNTALIENIYRNMRRISKDCKSNSQKSQPNHCFSPFWNKNSHRTQPPTINVHILLSSPFSLFMTFFFQSNYFFPHVTRFFNSLSQTG